MKTLLGIINARRENPTQYDENPSINLNQLNKYSKTLLEEACQRGKEEIVQLLIQAGANVNLKGSDNYNPLGTAILYYNNNTQSLNIIRELLENGADINMEYAKNQFPLIIACYKGYIHVVELLLHFSRVNVNIKDNNGDTPLIAIIEEAGSDLPCKTAIHLIKLLIERGADVSLQNSQGESPTIIARKNGSCPELVTFLEHYGPQFSMGPPIGLPKSRSRS
jgi:ankyrin repeat protein